MHEQQQNTARVTSVDFLDPQSAQSARRRTVSTELARDESQTSVLGMPPPSFAESELLTIQRRQINPRFLEVNENSRMIKWVESSDSKSAPGRKADEWEFAGWGSTYFLDVTRADADRASQRKGRALVGVLQGIGIAGNDVVGSVFYAIGPVVVAARQYAPISLLLVTMLLHPMRAIMNELAASLPFNGGAYVFFLNISAKWVAGIMATLAVLDYMATSVLSAASATSYLSSQFTLPSSFGVFPLTIAVIVVFGIITFVGIRESSTVASFIFLSHLITMTVLMITALVHWIRNGNDILISNWHTPYPDTNAAKLIWDGFCLALLGVTGFESTEGYLEDLKPGAFPTIMKFMWFCIAAVIAPTSLLVMAIVPMNEVIENPSSSILTLAKAVSNNSPWLSYWVVIDATIVLGAGVLTGMVGVLGLFERLSRDQILPPFLLIRNRWTGVFQYIIMFFMVLCITLYSITGGDMTSLSGVFAVAFLCVMISYAFANAMLYLNRPQLSRRNATRVPIYVTMVVFSILVGALVGNAVIDPSIFKTFAIYFVIVHAVLLGFMNRVWILRRILKVTGAGAIVLVPSTQSTATKDLRQPLDEDSLSDSASAGTDVDISYDGDVKLPTEPVRLRNIGSSSNSPRTATLNEDPEQDLQSSEQEEAIEDSRSSQLVIRGSHRLVNAFNSMLIKSMINSLRNHPVIYFTKSDSLTHLHRAIRYIRQNENSHKGNIRLVHIYRRVEDIPKRLEDNHRFLDELYPKIQIDLIFIQGTFDPDTIHAISQHLNVPKSAMFMSCPGESFPYNIEEFGGARIIMD
ncbi:hypothetical protein EMPS_07535 [Entomortierella parvispora]|uniref:Uncharacterized protein n=1 Tax=Entomortierella parvispora TaxID=205924 RepID=A0A9P3HEK5_9FUNG|nr:hypothetical protein EMPS_07535 [Entomortierella parvispora]